MIILMLIRLMNLFKIMWIFSLFDFFPIISALMPALLLLILFESANLIHKYLWKATRIIILRFRTNINSSTTFVKVFACFLAIIIDIYHLSRFLMKSVLFLIRLRIYLIIWGFHEVKVILLALVDIIHIVIKV